MTFRPIDDISGPLDDKCLSEESAVLIRCSGAHLPIILTAPHGGSLSSPVSQILKARTPGKGICTKSDLHTLRLLNNIDDHIHRLCGMHPHIVAARYHRKYIDANRDSEIAAQQPYHPKCKSSRAAYEEYHQSIEDCIAHCQQLWPHTSVLLLDIHGQRIYQDHIVLGTRSGETYYQPSDGSSARHMTPGYDFINLLRADLDLAILPHRGGADIPLYSGGYTVMRHSAPKSVDAIQLEFGSTLRSSSYLSTRAALVVAYAAARAIWPSICSHPLYRESAPSLLNPPRKYSMYSCSHGHLNGIVSKVFIPGKLVGPSWQSLSRDVTGIRASAGAVVDQVIGDGSNYSYSVVISQSCCDSSGRQESVCDVFECGGQPSSVQTSARLEAHSLSPYSRALCRSHGSEWISGVNTGITVASEDRNCHQIEDNRSGAGSQRSLSDAVEGVLLCFDHDAEVDMLKLEYEDYAQDVFLQEKEIRNKRISDMEYDTIICDEFHSSWSVGSVVLNGGVNIDAMATNLAWVFVD